jgi:hypothetical protein
MDANMLLAWHKYGGGKELLNKLYNSISMNVVSFPYAPMPTQPLGWFKKPITGPDDFKGLKFRTVGISIDVFQGMGAAVNALPGGEIVSAIDRGLLDAAPIFLPLLKHFNIDPILWGTLVFVNLQAAFLSPPVAMSAFYLKGVSPPHVTLNQIFNGMMPYMVVIILCMVIMYVWPGMTLWLPNYLYGG